MQGVRILEVAEHTFVPAASALLADWGAEVVKIEHVDRGDAMRGLASSGTVSFGGAVHVLLEHSNRGKQSLGLDLTSEDGLDVLYRLAATCDVFLTNKLASVRKKLKIDVDDIKAHNPNIIYVRGSGQGERGPEADRGSYDQLSYWCRSGIAMGVKQHENVPPPPAPAFGDSIGAMTIAGGIMGALFHRERTGEATTVDVSLLGTGLWSVGAAVALSLQWNPDRQPARVDLQDEGRPACRAVLSAGREVLAGRVPSDRAAGAGGRRALRGHRVDQRERARRRRDRRRGVRRAHACRVARAAC
jgi:crotonobetainyl-CoA:carnitine CoA-transferase CaiB-like acyl-CoA transferase